MENKCWKADISNRIDPSRVASGAGRLNNTDLVVDYILELRNGKPSHLSWTSSWDGI